MTHCTAGFGSRWSAEQQFRRLHLIANNSRFVILGPRGMSNLASRVLGLSLRRLSAYIEAAHGYPAFLAETFVDVSRFVVTSLSVREIGARELYEDLYCARGDMENRIKEQQFDLFADTALSRAQYGTIRARLLKVACKLRLSVRRVRLALSSVHPRQDLFRQVAPALRRAAAALCLKSLPTADDSVLFSRLAVRGSPECCRRCTDPRNPRRKPENAANFNARRCNLGLGERSGLDEAPIINHNCFGDAHDLDVIVEGVKIARRILISSAMDDYRGVERFGGIDVQSDDQIRDYAPSNVQTIYHPVGTRKMGSDGMAVVGADLRGHGIDGLRIADASIMPTIIIGNNNATSIIIGEKASYLIGN